MSRPTWDEYFVEIMKNSIINKKTEIFQISKNIEIKIGDSND